MRKKPRRVRGPQAANQVKSIFRGGMYVAKKTLRGESVPEWAKSPFGRAGRSENSLVQKGRRPFWTSLKAAPSGAAFAVFTGKMRFTPTRR